MKSTIEYKSKVGMETVLPIVLFLVLFMSFFLFKKIWIGVAIIFISLVAILYLLFSIKYYICNEDKTLIAKCGFFVDKINIDDIKWIKNTRSLLGSPAASIDRLEIRYQKYRSLLVSPIERQGFIEHLMSINSQIELKP